MCVNQMTYGHREGQLWSLISAPLAALVLHRHLVGCNCEIQCAHPYRQRVFGVHGVFDSGVYYECAADATASCFADDGI